MESCSPFHLVPHSPTFFNNLRRNKSPGPIVPECVVPAQRSLEHHPGDDKVPEKPTPSIKGLRSVFRNQQIIKEQEVPRTPGINSSHLSSHLHKSNHLPRRAQLREERRLRYKQRPKEIDKIADSFFLQEEIFG